MVLLFYTAYFSVDLAHHDMFRAKVGKGGINVHISMEAKCKHFERRELESYLSPLFDTSTILSNRS